MVDVSPVATVTVLLPRYEVMVKDVPATRALTRGFPYSVPDRFCAVKNILLLAVTPVVLITATPATRVATPSLLLVPSLSLKVEPVFEIPISPETVKGYDTVAVPTPKLPDIITPFVGA